MNFRHFSFLVFIPPHPEFAYYYLPFLNMNLFFLFTVPVEHFAKDETGISYPRNSEDESAHRSRLEMHMAQLEPAYHPGSSVPAERESKAERIARYKAERRRQLCERYRILLDEETTKDSRMRREPEGSDRQHKRQAEESEHNAQTSHAEAEKMPSKASVERAYCREQADAFSEHERRMNLENQKRVQDTGRTYGDGKAPDPSAPYIDTTGVSSVSREQQEVNGSPKAAQPAKRSTSPGDLFIEQQAHNVLQRHG